MVKGIGVLDTGVPDKLILIRKGVIVKLRYLLLSALVLLVPAGLAHATPVGDPSVVINRVPVDATTFTMNSITDPLVIVLNGQGLSSIETFDYEGTAPLHELFVELEGALPLEQFNCVSDIFTACGSFNTGEANDIGLIFEDGTLSKGDTFTVEVAAPEPGTMVLFLIGALALFGFAHRRLSAVQVNS